MSKWTDKLPLIRQRISEHCEPQAIADEIGTTLVNLHNICKRNAIRLDTAPFDPRLAKRGVVYDIPTAHIYPDPNQPRKQFDGDALWRLGEAMQTEGQQSPITFRLDGERVILVHGERRWRAAELVKMRTLRGTLDEANEDEPESDRILRQVSDNENREQLTQWDWVQTIDALRKRCMSYADISGALTTRGITGMSRPVVNNLHRLLQLPEPAQELVRKGWLTAAHGKYLLAVKDTDVLDELIEGLRDAEQNGDGAPPVSLLLLCISDAYKHCDYPYLNDNYAYWFDWEEECGACEQCRKITLSNGYTHAYCANAECYAEKTKPRTAPEPEQSEQEGEQEQTPNDRWIHALRNYTPLYASKVRFDHGKACRGCDFCQHIPDPGGNKRPFCSENGAECYNELQRQADAQLEEQRKQVSDRIKEDAERKHVERTSQGAGDRRAAWLQELQTKLRTCDRAFLVALFAFEHDDSDDRDLPYWEARARLHPEETLRLAAENLVTWSSKARPTVVAAALGMPAPSDYQLPTDDSPPDLLEGTAA